MKNIRAEVDRLESAFGGGEGGQVEIVPLLVPMQTYKILLDAGRKQGITPAEVLSRAIELYLRPKQDIKVEQEVQVKEIPKKNIAFIAKRGTK
jgi:hypothetical protein